MLQELFTELEKHIPIAIPSCRCGRYKGEFEDWGTYTASGTGMDTFMRLNHYPVGLRTIGNIVSKFKPGILLYIAGKDINTNKGLSMGEDLVNYFNGRQLIFTVTKDGKTEKIFVKTIIADEGLQFYGYNNQTEIYTLQLIVE
jgi:hypothetical protein